MTEIDERLERARTWPTAGDVPWLLDLVERLSARADAAEAEAAELRERLAEAEALVPDTKLVERAAKYASVAQDYYLEGSCGGSYPKQEADDEEALDDLAADIREWREGQREGEESDDNSWRIHRGAHPRYLFRFS